MELEGRTCLVTGANRGIGLVVAQRLAAQPVRLLVKLVDRAGIDRLSALHLGIELVRRGGTVSLSGVYGGAVDAMPMMTMFDTSR